MEAGSGGLYVVNVGETEGEYRLNWRKTWELCLKSRELSRNGKTKETALVYKLVAIIYI